MKQAHHFALDVQEFMAKGKTRATGIKASLRKYPGFIVDGFIYKFTDGSQAIIRADGFEIKE